MSERKIELRVISVSRGRFPNNAFNVLLEELENKTSFEIIIGYFEANSIGIALENQPSPRPMTHDLIINILDELKSEVQEVLIHRLSEGVFYSTIMIENNGLIYEIDSRTSDALAIALRVGCPIYTYPSILGQVINPQSLLEVISKVEEVDELNLDTKLDSSLDDLSVLTEDELNILLETHLSNEEYEKAARVRDELKKREH